jgi:hypothetical protein
MRTVASICALLCIGLIFSSFACAQNAGEMLQACEALERSIQIRGNNIVLPGGGDINRCWGFMSAVQQFSVLVDPKWKAVSKFLSTC